MSVTGKPTLTQSLGLKKEGEDDKGNCAITHYVSVDRLFVQKLLVK